MIWLVLHEVRKEKPPPQHRVMQAVSNCLRYKIIAGGCQEGAVYVMQIVHTVLGTTCAVVSISDTCFVAGVTGIDPCTKTAFKPDFVQYRVWVSCPCLHKRVMRWFSFSPSLRLTRLTQKPRMCGSTLEGGDTHQQSTTNSTSKMSWPTPPTHGYGNQIVQWNWKCSLGCCFRIGSTPRRCYVTGITL